MTTITELLTEVFNRVKSEHGVVLSRVDFTTGYGALADIEFVGTGCSTPSLTYGAPLPPDPTPPEATHTYNGWYLRRAFNGAWEWFFAGHWELSPKNIESEERHFTPLNPTSQSAADSDS